MRKLLIPLLSAMALSTAVNAEVASYYLLGIAERESFFVPMQTLEACEAAGKKFITSKAWDKRMENQRIIMTALSYLCVSTK